MLPLAVKITDLAQRTALTELIVIDKEKHLKFSEVHCVWRTSAYCKESSLSTFQVFSLVQVRLVSHRRKCYVSITVYLWAECLGSEAMVMPFLTYGVGYSHVYVSCPVRHSDWIISDTISLLLMLQYVQYVLCVFECLVSHFDMSSCPRNKLSNFCPIWTTLNIVQS